jgi:arylsulfatase A-like enzyme
MRRWLGLLIVGAAAATLDGCSHERGPRRSNVLLVTVDTLRADHVGCYGYARATTPWADRLAAEGTRFDQAVVPMPETLPSIASIFTATYPMDHGVRGNHYQLQGGPTLAEVLAQQGWLTAGFASSVVVEAATGIGRGFAVYDATPTAPFMFLPAGQRLAQDTTDAARAWLEQQVAAGRRDGLFLWVHFIDPHALYSAPPPYGDRFVDAAYSGPIRDDTRQFFDIVEGKLTLDAADMQYLIDRYDGEVAYADAQLGRLLSALDELKLDDTLVVYTADHGESLGEHGYLFDHGEYLYEDQLRVPLILRHPDLPRGRVVDEQVETVDILPTILDWLGLAAGPSIRGRSLLPLARGQDVAGPPRLAYSESDACEPGSLRACGPYGIAGKLVAIRAGGWKLIYDPRGRHALFDLRADPGETVDRAAEQPELASRLARQLGQLLKQGSPHADTQELDPATIEKLRALGYVR